MSFAAALADGEGVDLDAEVDDQVAGDQWADGREVTAEGLHGFPHRGEVYNAGHAGEALKDDVADREGDLFLRGVPGVVAGHTADIVGGDERPVNAAEHGLEDNAYGAWQTRAGLVDPGLAQCREAEIGAGGTVDENTLRVPKHKGNPNVRCG